MIFDFTASSTFELTASAGTPIWVVEADDGSGWVKVSDGRKEGLVPSSYLQMNSAPPAVKPSTGARGAKAQGGKTGSRLEEPVFFSFHR